MFQVNTVIDIQVIRQNVFRHAIVLVIGTSSTMAMVPSLAASTVSYFFHYQLPLLVVFPLAVSLPLAELGTAGVIGRCTLLTKNGNF